MLITPHVSNFVTKFRLIRFRSDWLKLFSILFDWMRGYCTFFVSDSSPKMFIFKISLRGIRIVSVNIIVIQHCFYKCFPSSSPCFYCILLLCFCATHVHHFTGLFCHLQWCIQLYVLAYIISSFFSLIGFHIW